MTTKEKSGLGTFKISDAVKRPVSPNSPAQAGSASKKKGAKEEPAPSVGFPSLERLIEADTLDRSGLQARVEALEAVAKSGGNKEKAGARKALLAYERTNELLDYLWNTKLGLANPEPPAAPEATEEPKASPKKKK